VRPIVASEDRWAAPERRTGRSSIDLICHGALRELQPLSVS